MRDKPLLYLLDDDIEFCRELADLLGGQYRLEHFQKAEAFETQLNTKTPDLCLVDLDLGQKKSGLDVIREIKARKDSHLLPIVIISGSSEDLALQQAFRSGIEDYVIKPPLPRFLLKKIEHVLFNTHQKIHTHALTGLPGIGIIEKEFYQRSQADKLLTLGYLDLDNFKPFNDSKGVKKGDEAIVIVAEVLKEVRARYSKGQLFVGHLGGDDFFLLGEKSAVHRAVAETFDVFSEKIKVFFSDEEINRGTYSATSRQNQEEQFPLLSLSCAYVHKRQDQSCTFDFISEVAATAKKKAKAIKGNSEAEIDLDAPVVSQAQKRIFQAEVSPGVTEQKWMTN